MDNNLGIQCSQQQHGERAPDTFRRFVGRSLVGVFNEHSPPNNVDSDISDGESVGENSDAEQSTRSVRDVNLVSNVDLPQASLELVNVAIDNNGRSPSEVRSEEIIDLTNGDGSDVSLSSDSGLSEASEHDGVSYSQAGIRQAPENLCEKIQKNITNPTQFLRDKNDASVCELKTELLGSFSDHTKEIPILETDQCFYLLLLSNQEYKELFTAFIANNATLGLDTSDLESNAPSLSDRLQDDRLAVFKKIVGDNPMSFDDFKLELRGKLEETLVAEIGNSNCCQQLLFDVIVHLIISFAFDYFLTPEFLSLPMPKLNYQSLHDLDDLMGEYKDQLIAQRVDVSSDIAAQNDHMEYITDTLQAMIANALTYFGNQDLGEDVVNNEEMSCNFVEGLISTAFGVKRATDTSDPDPFQYVTDALSSFNSTGVGSVADEQTELEYSSPEMFSRGDIPSVLLYSNLAVTGFLFGVGMLVSKLCKGKHQVPFFKLHPRQFTSELLQGFSRQAVQYWFGAGIIKAVLEVVVFRLINTSGKDRDDYLKDFEQELNQGIESIQDEFAQKIARLSTQCDDAEAAFNDIAPSTKGQFDPISEYQVFQWTSKEATGNPQWAIDQGYDPQTGLQQCLDNQFSWLSELSYACQGDQSNNAPTLRYLENANTEVSGYVQEDTDALVWEPSDKVDQSLTVMATEIKFPLTQALVNNIYNIQVYIHNGEAKAVVSRASGDQGAYEVHSAQSETITLDANYPIFFGEHDSTRGTLFNGFRTFTRDDGQVYLTDGSTVQVKNPESYVAQVSTDSINENEFFQSLFTNGTISSSNFQQPRLAFINTQSASCDTLYSLNEADNGIRSIYEEYPATDIVTNNDWDVNLDNVDETISGYSFSCDPNLFDLVALPITAGTANSNEFYKIANGTTNLLLVASFMFVSGSLASLLIILFRKFSRKVVAAKFAQSNSEVNPSRIAVLYAGVKAVDVVSDVRDTIVSGAKNAKPTVVTSHV